MNDDHRRMPYLTGSPNFLSASPYLNIDPRIFKTEPQYIMPEGASPRRGRFEYAFSQIGGSVILGAGVGGMQGVYAGLNDKALTGELMSAARRTHVVNAFTKYSASTAGALGVIALLYSGFGTAFSLARGADDDFNTLASGTLTGMLYKSTSGSIQKVGAGGLVGLALSGAFALITKQDFAVRLMNRLNPKRW